MLGEMVKMRFEKGMGVEKRKETEEQAHWVNVENGTSSVSTLNGMRFVHCTGFHVNLFTPENNSM